MCAELFDPPIEVAVLSAHTDRATSAPLEPEDNAMGCSAVTSVACVQDKQR